MSSSVVTDIINRIIQTLQALSSSALNYKVRNARALKRNCLTKPSATELGHTPSSKRNFKNYIANHFIKNVN